MRLIDIIRRHRTGFIIAITLVFVEKLPKSSSRRCSVAFSTP